MSWANPAAPSSASTTSPPLATTVARSGSKPHTGQRERFGFGDAGAQVQDLYLSGRRVEAAAAVPDALVDEVALVGPLDRIVDRLERWKASRVDTLILGTRQPEVARGPRRRRVAGA